MTSYILTFLAGAICAAAIMQIRQIIRRRSSRAKANNFIRVILQQNLEHMDSRGTVHQSCDRRWKTTTNFTPDNANN
jgi:hypothetical protein